MGGLAREGRRAKGGGHHYMSNPTSAMETQLVLGHRLEMFGRALAAQSERAGGGVLREAPIRAGSL